MYKKVELGIALVFWAAFCTVACVEEFLAARANWQLPRPRATASASEQKTHQQVVWFFLRDYAIYQRVNEFAN